MKERVRLFLEYALPGTIVLLGLALFSVLVPETGTLWYGYFRIVMDLVHWTTTIIVLEILILFPAVLGLVTGNKAHWKTQSRTNTTAMRAWAMILITIAIALAVVWPVVVMWLANFDSFLANIFREFAYDFVRFENPPIGWGIYAGGLFFVVGVWAWFTD